MPPLHELSTLRVYLDRVEHLPHHEAPPEKPHAFAYFLTIENGSPEVVTIRGRKWVITEAGGECVVVEGEGVVGKFPRLEPGERFSYNSYHVIGSDSVAEGAFIGMTDGGRAIVTRIPKFTMQIPE